jgi:6-phosphogluconolactonase
MQQGPVPTQLCCGTSKLGGARRTRMKESHEVHEIRQGPSDERPFCWRCFQRYVLHPSYSVGYLYVTGTVTATTSGNGIISGFKIDHNTGKLTPSTGLPVSSGGANPVRAVLLTGSRFLYVLNRGVRPTSGGSDLHHGEYPCQNSNITQFAIGANGILTPQETFYTQGLNPFRMIADSSGSYLYVLDHDSLYNGAPSSATNPNPNCAAALTGATTCGDITAFSVNATTGRLQLLVNKQVTASGGVAPR